MRSTHEWCGRHMTQPHEEFPWYAFYCINLPILVVRALFYLFDGFAISSTHRWCWCCRCLLLPATAKCANTKLCNNKPFCRRFFPYARARFFSFFVPPIGTVFCVALNGDQMISTAKRRHNIERMKITCTDAVRRKCVRHQWKLRERANKRTCERWKKCAQ